MKSSSGLVGVGRSFSKRALLVPVCLLLCIGAGCGSTSTSSDHADAQVPSSVSAEGGATVLGPDTAPPEALCALTGPPPSTPGETLVFADDFDGTAVDTNRWALGSGRRGPTNILSTTSPADLAVHDGSLFVTAERSPAGAEYPWTTGYMETLGKFARTYGKVEFRARFPYAAGIWYAMWGRVWFDTFPEIDVEMLNTASVPQSQAYFVNHWGSPPIPADQRSKYVMFEDVDTTAFHTYTVTWTPGLLEWAVDGVTKLQSNGLGVPTKPVYWMINSWVGGWAETPPDSSTQPVTFEVDYMHVYRLDGLVGDPAIHVANTQTTFANTDTIQIGVANFDEACARITMSDGSTVVHTTSTFPYQFSLARLSRGPHTLNFAATDGVRSTTTSVNVTVE